MDKLNYTVHHHYIMQCTLSNWSLCLSPGLPAQGRRQRLNSWCHSSDHEQSATLAGRFGLKAWVWELLVVYSGEFTVQQWLQLVVYGKILYHNTTSISYAYLYWTQYVVIYYIIFIMYCLMIPFQFTFRYCIYDLMMTSVLETPEIVPEYSSQQCHLVNPRICR